jgi:outer membrane murein-binding lipoprotein Lpp
VQALVDVVQLDQQQLVSDTSSGAPAATIRQDTQTLNADSHQLERAEEAFAEDTADDTTP